MDTAYPKGSDLSEFFAKPVKPLTKAQVQKCLPVMFDDSCKRCEKPMELMPVFYSTRRKPFATFQCPTCKLRLLIFEAPKTPLLVWSDAFAGQVDFSAFIDHVLVEREHKRERNLLRYGVMGYITRFIKSLR